VQGYLARVQCVEVWCPMTPLFMDSYLTASKRERKDLWIMNPNKLAAVEFLVHFWEEQGHKIIVFSDDLRPVIAYSQHLGRKCMTGSSDDQTREELLSKFRVVVLSHCVDVLLVDVLESQCVVTMCTGIGCLLTM
jgi:DNA excision repair protein ERCC-3